MDTRTAGAELGATGQAAHWLGPPDLGLGDTAVWEGGVRKRQKWNQVTRLVHSHTPGSGGFLQSLRESLRVGNHAER